MTKLILVILRFYSFNTVWLWRCAIATHRAFFFGSSCSFIHIFARNASPRIEWLVCLNESGITKTVYRKWNPDSHSSPIACTPPRRRRSPLWPGLGWHRHGANPCTGPLIVSALTHVVDWSPARTSVAGDRPPSWYHPGCNGVRRLLDLIFEIYIFGKNLNWIPLSWHGRVCCCHANTAGCAAVWNFSLTRDRSTLRCQRQNLANNSTFWNVLNF